MELERINPIPKIDLKKGDIIQIYHCYTLKKWRGEYIEVKQKSSIEEIITIIFLIDYIANYLPNVKYVDDCVGESEVVNIIEFLFKEKFEKLNKKSQDIKENHSYSLDVYEIGECDLRIDSDEKKGFWYRNFKGNEIALKLLDIRKKELKNELVLRKEKYKNDEDYKVLEKVYKIFQTKELNNCSWNCLWGDTNLKEFMNNFNIKVQ